MALNMRAGLAAVTPLLSQIQQELGLSGAAAGLLMAIPLAILGVGAFAAPRLLFAMGLDRAIALCAGLIAIGLLARPLSGVALLFIGTAVFSTGVAFANVLIPTAIKRDLHGRLGLATAAYTTVLTGAAATGAFITPYAASTSGLTWRSALALWTIPAIIASALWLIQSRRSHPPTGAPTSLTSGLRLLRDKAARSVVAYTGLQALTYYTALTWMPTLYVDAGLTPAQAGALLAVSTLIGLPIAFFAPLLALRLRHPGRLAAFVSLVAAGGVLACLWLPTQYLAVGAVLIGIGQAAAFPLSILFVQLRSDTPAHTAQLAGTAQGIGYLISAMGPLLVGTLYGVTGAWALPAGSLAALLVVQAISGARAGHPEGLGARHSRA
jgi:CP family cyanate transporter-like MFS transporter